MPFLLSLLMLALATAVSPAAKAADKAPAVVVTLKPLHGLAAAVMQGTGVPHLLIPGAVSPHTYTMKPSDARRLAAAAVVFRVGPNLETFLERPLKALASKARLVDLINTPGLRLHAYRDLGHGEAHGHDHGHKHEHKDAPAGKHPGTDPHIWLDPVNASRMAERMAAALAAADPPRAARYRQNAAQLQSRLSQLDRDLGAALKPLAGRPYVVFHDAYQYLEAPYGLAPAGVIALSPDKQPGAQHIRRIRHTIADMGARCIFAEPQFPARLIDTIAADSPARTAVLDPLGSAAEPGPGAYEAIMRTIAATLTGCLGDK